MTDSRVIDLPLPDADARARIERDLDANILVEAGAGSGKTTALVRRMVALVQEGAATVDEIAAVTFTRKAASELRERFQLAIEERLRQERAAEDADDVRLERLEAALEDVDRAFVGTIHSFCGRLLRERPLEIGLDPGFQELPVEERITLRRRFWDAYLERLVRDSDPVLEELSRAGISPSSLFGLFDTLVENPDVEFPAEARKAPSVSEVGDIRQELEAIVDRGWELMDEMPPPKGWDSLQRKIRQLHFEREITGWQEAADLFGAVALLCKPGPRGHDTTLKRWRDKDLARSLKERVNAFGVGDTPANRLVDRWYAHRYALAIRLGRAAAEAFEAHRLRIGKLDFQDLLLLAARLLRTRPDVRSALGARYRRLLVDEFQDTDPLQAEIMLLLSSEPGTEDGDGAADWRTAVPRPGGLFVVGDPKQSIYRFRRADIQLYAFVKERFAEFGELLSLSTNFRSRPPIGDLVNGVFDDPGFFPGEATDHQAAFERLATRPPTDHVAAEGIFHYEIAPGVSRKAEAATDDAKRLAGWIRERVDSGQRLPEDFLILTWDRGQLAVYARELEAYALPVQVTGAGVGVDQEIHELGVLLECLIDPTNPVKVVAALVGLFFGLDYEQLLTHRLAQGSLDAMSPGDRGDPDVLAGLRTLHGWWSRSKNEPADVSIGRLVTELGLLPFAAAGALGSLRAGALQYALDAIRGAALAGETSLPGALEAFRAALALREAEAPLEPGRSDAVRLMNLHQAKGLEGTVVVLANPTATSLRDPEVHLTRTRHGAAEGFLRVTAATPGFRKSLDLARPSGWRERQAAEARFEAAEVVRLLYVAVTRAREELVIARWSEGRGDSAWSSLDEWLDANGQRLDLEIMPPEGRLPLDAAVGALHLEARQAARALEMAGLPTYTHSTVTRRTKASQGDHMEATRRFARGEDTAIFRGFSWGSAVHGALAVAVDDPREDVLRSACRDLLVEYERPLDDHGEPLELRELLDLVETVRSSDLWARAAAADMTLAEIAFAVPMSADGESDAEHPDTVRGGTDDGDEGTSPSRQTSERRQLDLFGETEPVDPGREDEGPGPRVPLASEAIDEAIEGAATDVLEGVVDLAFRESDGWVIADYKTDLGTDPDFQRREADYRRQVDLYAEAWARLTGESVKERVLFFTAQGRVEQW